MHPRIPPVLHPVFECYLSSIRQCLPNFLSSFYLVGSIALDEFNPHFSDIDFVALTDRPAIKSEIEALREVHREVERYHQRWKLSGIYLLQHEVGKQEGDAKNLVEYHDGRLRTQDSFERNPITWWILKNQGIPLVGSDPCELPITGDANILVAWTHENMNSYWKGWTQRPGRLILLLTDWGIQWSVLGVLRQFYTIREKKIITKRRAGDYGLSNVAHPWHRIINEAIRIRTKARGSFFHSRLARAMQAAYFLRHIIAVSNDYLKSIQQG